jgi:hypothetical protein
MPEHFIDSHKHARTFNWFTQICSNILSIYTNMCEHFIDLHKYAWTFNWFTQICFNILLIYTYAWTFYWFTQTCANISLIYTNMLEHFIDLHICLNMLLIYTNMREHLIDLHKYAWTFYWFTQNYVLKKNVYLFHRRKFNLVSQSFRENSDSDTNAPQMLRTSSTLF